MKRIKQKTSNNLRQFLLISAGGLFLLLTTYYLLPTNSAQAETIGIATTENVYDLELYPGANYNGEITVFNQSDNLALPVSVKLNLWNLAENSDDIEFITAEEALNATRWFSFEEGTNFILSPRGTAEEDATVSFNIDIPVDTPPGSYFVMMRYEAVIPPHYYINDGPRVSPEVGVLFFIRVTTPTLEGYTTNYEAEIVSFQPKDITPLPVASIVLPKAHAGVFEKIVKKVEASVKNNGIYHFATDGQIVVENMFGKNIATIELPERIMMPNRTRSFDVNIVEDESFWERNFRFGRYTATMVLNVPEHDSPLVSTIVFWAFPWKVFGAIIVVLLLVGEFRKRIFSAIRILIRGEKINS